MINLKGENMQIALNIGTINIQNQEIANFIQNKSIEEIKALFLNFLTKEVKTLNKNMKYKDNTEKEFQEFSNIALEKVWDNKEDEIYDRFL